MAKNTAQQTEETPGTELDNAFRAEIDGAMGSFQSFDDLAAWFESKGVDLFDNGTDRVKSLDTIEDKSILIGVPFAIMQWRFNQSDKYRDGDGNFGVFVSAEIAYPASKETGEPLRKPGKAGTYLLKHAVLNDGGSGICQDLQEITDARRANGLSNTQEGRGVTKGLRVSQYTYTDPETGASSEAETYYLDF